MADHTNNPPNIGKTPEERSSPDTGSPLRHSNLSMDSLDDTNYDDLRRKYISAISEEYPDSEVVRILELPFQEIVAPALLMEVALGDDIEEAVFAIDALGKLYKNEAEHILPCLMDKLAGRRLSLALAHLTEIAPAAAVRFAWDSMENPDPLLRLKSLDILAKYAPAIACDFAQSLVDDPNSDPNSDIAKKAGEILVRGKPSIDIVSNYILEAKIQDLMGLTAPTVLHLFGQNPPVTKSQCIAFISALGSGRLTTQLAFTYTISNLPENELCDLAKSSIRKSRIFSQLLGGPPEPSDLAGASFHDNPSFSGTIPLFLLNYDAIRMVGFLTAKDERTENLARLAVDFMQLINPTVEVPTIQTLIDYLTASNIDVGELLKSDSITLRDVIDLILQDAARPSLDAALKDRILMLSDEERQLLELFLPNGDRVKEFLKAGI